jgi:hypothetical protein
MANNAVGRVSYYRSRAKTSRRAGRLAPVLGSEAATGLSDDNILIAPRKVKKQNRPLRAGGGEEGQFEFTRYLVASCDFCVTWLGLKFMTGFVIGHKLVW